MKKTPALAAVAIAAALLALSSYASPYWTLHQMKTAIAEKDADGLSEHIDFPALRESFKGQMMTMMQKRLGSAGMANNPFAAMGQMMGAALVNQVVDAAVSPAGVMAMMEAGKVKPGARPAPAADADAAIETTDYSVDYRGWSKVAISTSQQDAGKFILKRTGLWSWQLSALELPESTLNAAD
ncbi:DUF2939 domain-containing protein [Massilia sp. IC2-278]|uniref:DUF2939 domain-containing protein n=1 Tax=Massilia sp. IC2-278 TaxID=2887200 RepID=UPI001E55622C|nr:DUF2939 domain-containing protein [Massilia sp. IC2-278]MCC2959899.1 DUF2939 domain-containing protein [Massilia sp. IC2-278]